jgi:hypothetical protein
VHLNQIEYLSHFERQIWHSANGLLKIDHDSRESRQSSFYYDIVVNGFELKMN